ncbi:MAG: SAM-dependent methyltransferase [Chloroflexales bacterium]|nr:SAM-dependent methyltransferase [Chloroflexales bacterium]
MRNRPSRTAQSVAMNVLLLSYDPVFGRLVPPDVAAPTRWCLEAAVGRFVVLFDIPLFRIYARYIERTTIPGIAVHNVTRKRWIEDKAREAITLGCSQVVVLGAGYDTLAYRLHRQFSQVHWWEIDHPATQRCKRVALDRHGGVQRNLQLLPVDFTRQTLATVLQSTAGYDREAVSLFIAEGVLMYLTATEASDLLQAVHDHSGPHSRIVGTALAPAPDGRLAIQGASERVNRQLQRAGEPFHWGLARAALPAFLAAHAFRAIEITPVRAVLPQYLSAVPDDMQLPEGEYLFYAERS